MRKVCNNLEIKIYALELIIFPQRKIDMGVQKLAMYRRADALKVNVILSSNI